jgi:hypothetical protein
MGVLSGELLNMAKGFFVDRAIEDAAFILERIDARWPAIVNSFSAKEPLGALVRRFVSY